MTRCDSNLQRAILVAVDIAKMKKDVVVQTPEGNRKRFSVANSRKDFHALASYLKYYPFPR